MPYTITFPDSRTSASSPVNGDTLMQFNQDGKSVGPPQTANQIHALLILHQAQIDDLTERLSTAAPFIGSNNPFFVPVPQPINQEETDMQNTPAVGISAPTPDPNQNKKGFWSTLFVSIKNFFTK